MTTLTVPQAAFTPHALPLPDDQLDSLSLTALAALRKGRIEAEMRTLVYDFSFFGVDGLQTMLDHFNSSLADKRCPYRLAVQALGNGEGQLEVVTFGLLMKSGKEFRPTGKPFTFNAPAQQLSH